MRTKEIQKMIKEGLFKANVELSRKEVEKLTRRARPSSVFTRKTIKAQIASNLRLVEFQTGVNKQLHAKGLHLKSVDYYSSFRVLPRKETAAVIDMYYNRSDNALDSGNTLVEGRQSSRR
jgi:hypothetical protein